MADIELRVREDAGERLTLGDLLVMEEYSQGKRQLSVADVVELLRKALVNDPLEIPLAALPKAVGALVDALQKAMGGEEEAKN